MDTASQPIQAPAPPEPAPKPPFRRVVVFTPITA
jgi:hypothetical protein